MRLPPLRDASQKVVRTTSRQAEESRSECDHPQSQATLQRPHLGSYLVAPHRTGIQNFAHKVSSLRTYQQEWWSCLQRSGRRLRRGFAEAGGPGRRGPDQDPRRGLRGGQRLDLGDVKESRVLVDHRRVRLRVRLGPFWQGWGFHLARTLLYLPADRLQRRRDALGKGVAALRAPALASAAPPSAPQKRGARPPHC